VIGRLCDRSGGIVLPLFGLITGLADDEDAVYHTRDPVIYQQSAPFSTLRGSWDKMAATLEAWKRRHIYGVHDLPAKESQEDVDQQMVAHTVFYANADRRKNEAEHEGHDVDGPIRVTAHSVVLAMVFAVVVDMTRIIVLAVVLAVVLDMTRIVVLDGVLVVLLVLVLAMGLVVGLVVVHVVDLVVVLAVTFDLALAANHLGRRS